MSRYLIIIVVMALIVSTPSAYSLEHSALSNIFTLDTRDGQRIPLEHSAISNIFTLDTRDAGDYKITAIDPNPNPSEPTVMSDGMGYLYYRVTDSGGNPVKDVYASYKVNRNAYKSPLTSDDGLLVIAVDTVGEQSGSILDIEITHIGATELADPIFAQIQVTQREYDHQWSMGSSISGKFGLAAGPNAYVKAKTEGGISYTLDESDTLTVDRSAEGAVGGGVGVKTPGAKLTISAVKATTIAEASAELLIYSTFADKYVFDDRHLREQQMAQAALLIDTAMSISGKPVPLSTWLVKALMDRVTNYESYRTGESRSLGVLASGTAGASAGIKLGSIKTGIPNKPITGVTIGGSVEGKIGIDFEYGKFYDRGVFDGSSYALNQEFGANLDITALVGVGKPPDNTATFTGTFTKDYISASAGADYGESGFAGIFGTFGIGNMWRFREEYVTDRNGNPREFVLTIGDDLKTIRFTVDGKDISKIAQSVANLAAFIDVANQIDANIGEKAIGNELKKLFDQLARMEIKYVVEEGSSKGFSFPIDLEGNLGLDVGVSYEINASENLTYTVVDGVFLNGKLYPYSSYTIKPQSNAQLKSIVDDSLKGSWEMVKDAFGQVKESIIAGTEAVIESVATLAEKGVSVVRGTAKLIAKFHDDVAVTLTTWVVPPEKQIFPAPSSAKTAYQQALDRAMTPVIGGYYQFSPEGEELAEPGELTITYTDDEIAGLGINENSLRISYWDTENSRWVSVGGSVDPVNNSVTATITALHLYAITFDATPPNVSQMTPPPDSMIKDASPVIGADIIDDTNQLDTSSIALLLDGVEVIHNIEGTFVYHVTAGLAIGTHSVTIKASDLFGNATEETWSFTIRNPEMAKWDIDGNGVVDMADLTLVSNDFGKSGKGVITDLNEDGVVNIVDLVIVSSHFGEQTGQGAPPALQMPDDSQIVVLKDWLDLAMKADDGSMVFRQGISALKRLINSIVPSQTALFNNYPNPFNPETWIPYQLSKDSDVSITIYDALGRIVKNLDLGHKTAGIYVTQDRAVHWDGRNEAGETVASGVYFVVLKAGEYQKALRIVLIR